MGFFIALFLLTGGILALVNSFQMVSFGLGYLDYYSAAPDFFTTGNFWAWIVGFIVLSTFFAICAKIGTLVLKIIVGGTYRIVLISTKDYFSRQSNAFTTATAATLLLVIAWVIASFFITHAVFRFTAQYGDITNYFVYGNWIAYVMVFMVILFAPVVSKTNAND